MTDDNMKRGTYIIGGRDRWDRPYLEIGRGVRHSSEIVNSGNDLRLRLTLGWAVRPSAQRIGGVLYVAVGPVWGEVNVPRRPSIRSSVRSLAQRIRRR